MNGPFKIMKKDSLIFKDDIFVELTSSFGQKEEQNFKSIINKSAPSASVYKMPYINNLISNKKLMNQNCLEN